MTENINNNVHYLLITKIAMNSRNIIFPNWFEVRSKEIFHWLNFFYAAEFKFCIAIIVEVFTFWLLSCIRCLFLFLENYFLINNEHSIYVATLIVKKWVSVLNHRFNIPTRVKVHQPACWYYQKSQVKVIFLFLIYIFFRLHQRRPNTNTNKASAFLFGK